MSNQATRLSNCPAERLAHCRSELEPSAGGDLKGLPQRKTGSPSLSNHRSYNDGFNTACDKWEPHVTRLQAQVSALQQRLNIADQHVSDLEVEVAKLRCGPCELIYGDELPSQGIPGTSFQRLNALANEGE
jgi:hypothetical protein